MSAGRGILRQPVGIKYWNIAVNEIAEILLVSKFLRFHITFDCLQFISMVFKLICISLMYQYDIE